MTTRVLVGPGSGSPWAFYDGADASYLTITDEEIEFRAKAEEGFNAQGPQVISETTLFALSPIPETSEFATPSFEWEVTWIPRNGDYPSDAFPHVYFYADLAIMGEVFIDETLAYVTYIRNKHALTGEEIKSLTIMHRGFPVNLDGSEVPDFVPDVPITFELSYDAAMFTTNVRLEQGANLVTGESVAEAYAYDASEVQALTGFYPMGVEAEGNIVGEITQFIVSWDTPNPCGRVTDAAWNPAGL